MVNPYNKSILREIKENTSNNNHVYNKLYIAKKGNLSTEKDLKTIYDRQEKRGYLNEADSKKVYNLQNKSLNEVKEKYGEKTRDDIYMRT